MERPNAELYRAAWSKLLTTGQVAEALGMDFETFIQKLSVELPREEKERILAVIERTERRPPDTPLKPCDAMEIIVQDYERIIVFRDEEAFKGMVEASPCLKAIYGTEDHEKQLYPGLYVAAVVTGN